MSIGKILILESEDVIVQQLLDQLHQFECEAAVVSTVAGAMDCLAEEEFDLVIAEVPLPDGSAMDLLCQLASQAAPPAVLVISEFGSVESAIECLRQGAIGYLLKPFSRAQVEVMLGKVEEHLRLMRLNRLLSQGPEVDGGWELLGESSAMRLLRQAVRQVAPTDATVLVSGESGTGKARVARTIYAQSPRLQMPLVKVDCARFTDERLVVELFGQERGGSAFGGALYPGRFELVDGGTIVLDEVSGISEDIQTRLLQVLQNQSVQRLEGSRHRKVDVRVLATTSRSLEELVKNEQFREDLYLRLNIVPVAIPPLRERISDVPLLAEYFRQRFVRKHHSSALAISPECVRELQSYNWPGNVRELKLVIERAVIACAQGSVLEPTHLKSFPGGADREVAELPAVAPADIPDDLREIEKQNILRVVEKCNGNRTHAAKRLGISIRTLRNKLKEYRLAEAEAAKETSPQVS